MQADPTNLELKNTFNQETYKDLFLSKISFISNSLRKSLDFLFKTQCQLDDFNDFYRNLFDKMNQGKIILKIVTEWHIES